VDVVAAVHDEIEIGALGNPRGRRHHCRGTAPAKCYGASVSPVAATRGGVVSLLVRINLWLCAAFLLATLAAVALLQTVLHEDARKDTIAEARLLMAAAQAAREYTSSEVGPSLEHGTAHAAAVNAISANGSDNANGAPPVPVGEAPFYPQSIPAYAAIQIFAALREKEPAYSYRETALNPTNPRDKAVSWEADVIHHFRANPRTEEIINEHNGELGKSLYLAKPIRIDDGRCLACHDRASAAPAAMLRQYGSSNGFGWKLHETIGAQIVSVPLDTAISGADRAVTLLVGAMTALFVLTFIIVNVVVRQLVLKRIVKLTHAARSISTGRADEVKLDTSGKDEIAELCRSFERMRTSVEKSLALLARSG
jgi:HAMP domain-containing protein